MKTSLLELRHVSKSFSIDDTKIDVLNDVCLKINKGEFLAIMGPSGSGKSTLMYIIGCLDRPTEGQIIIDGKDISNLSEYQLAKIRNTKIGFVFQMFNLLPRTSALANITLPVIYSDTLMEEGIKRARELAEEMGISHRLEHSPNQLSGGEQQRVAIARALINRPSIILADEPTGNLDTKSGREIMDIFEKLHREGNTIILVTHDQEIAKYAHKIIRIQDGRIIRSN